VAEQALRDNLAPAVRPAGGRLGARLADFAYPVVTLVAVLALWQIVVLAFAVPAYILPAPGRVLQKLVATWPVLLSNSLYTAQEILLGFALSVVVGVPLAVAIVSSRRCERALYPILVGSQVVPKVAIAPLFVVWFGFGISSKVLIAFLIAFFPVVIDAVVGLRSVEPEKLYVARSMGANAWQLFWKVRLPKALPSLFGGLKVSITLAVVGAIVGEFIAAERGIGRVLLTANGNMDSELLFAGIIVLTVLGVLLFLAIDLLERWLLPWHVSRRMEALSDATL
jgi:NitT/TauT family transport system permease protein